MGLEVTIDHLHRVMVRLRFRPKGTIEKTWTTEGGETG